MARPAKVGGLRTTRVGEETGEERSVLPDKKTGVYQFRSRWAAHRFSVRRRKIERGPDGEKMEVAPRTSDDYDLPLDLVQFEENYFETPSKELAEALVEKAKRLLVYGVGKDIWSLEDERVAHDKAFERELRDKIASRPDIAARVLTPGEGEDLVLPPPPPAS